MEEFPCIDIASYPAFPIPRYVFHIQPPSHTVTLKDGLDLQVLSSGKGTEFEIDDLVPPMDARNGEEEEGFDQEDVYRQLNYECAVAGGEDSDDGLVRETSNTLGCPEFLYILDRQSWTTLLM